MKLVLFQQSEAGPQLPGLLTDRGVVDISGAVRSSYTPQLVMEGIIQDFDKLRPALETASIDSIKGHVAMRACDHQVVQGGYIVKVGKTEGYNTPVPQIIATFPGDDITPACRQMTFED